MYSLLFMKITPFWPFFKYFFIMMMSEELLKRFCSNRNIKYSTLKSYRSAIAKYEFFHDMDMDPLWMRQLLRKMKEFHLRTGKLKADCWISGLFYWIQVWLSALSEPIFPESRHSIGILKLNCPI